VNTHKRSFLAEIGLPILVGVLIEVSSELLKLATHHVSTSVASELWLGVFGEIRDSNFWLAILFAIGLLAGALWTFERWPRPHPKPWVRIAVVIVSVIIAAIVDPFGRAFRDEILSAYKQAQIGELMVQVLNRFQHDTGIVVEPNKDKEHHDALDCIGECGLRLIYDVPVVFGESRVTLEFGRDQTLIRKCNPDLECCPPRPPKDCTAAHGS
jgi:hypothetical protein